MLAIAPPAFAQSRASENATMTQTIAGATITIDYNRPSMRGRDSIFGGQVEWGHMWTSANRVTTLATSQSIKLNGQAIAAGKYGVWIHVRQGGNWVFHLHPDTARWHLPSPAASEMTVSIPVSPTRTQDSRESLSWDFDSVRAGSAQLVMWWGRTRLALNLEVESVPRTQVAAQIAARYSGVWTEQLTRDTSMRRQITVGYDQATRNITWTTPDFGEPGHGITWGMMLVPRAEDVFIIGYSINNELAQLSAANQQGFVEFTVENGRAVSFVRRNAEDRILGRGVRTR